MGLLNAVKGFQREGKGNAYINNTRDIPIEVVEPMMGRVLELKVIEPDKELSKKYLDKLIAHAEKLKLKYDVEWELKKNMVIRFTFPSIDMAEDAYRFWKPNTVIGL